MVKGPNAEAYSVGTDVYAVQVPTFAFDAPTAATRIFCRQPLGSDGDTINTTINDHKRYAKVRRYTKTRKYNDVRKRIPKTHSEAS